MRTILIAILCVHTLGGCTVGYFNGNVQGALPITLPLKPCAQVHQLENCVSSDEDLKPEAIYKAEVGIQISSRPKIGLSLSGGGSKTAPFSLGVIQALVEKGWLEQVDYISSVSGGGYAALYLYANALRVAETPSNGSLRNYFSDVRLINTIDAPEPTPVMATKGFVPVRSHASAKDLLADPVLSDRCKDIYTEREEKQVGNNRYLAWVDCYQDVLFRWPGGISRNINPLSPWSQATVAISEDLLLLPISLTANVLFDWRKSITIAQPQYARGVFRTYGYQPTEKDSPPVSLWFSNSIPDGMNAFSFRRLRQLYNPDAKLRMPIWIMNATSGSGNIVMDLDSSPYDLSKAIFEITPFGYGSGKYGYVRGYPDDIGLSVPDAILASAAFLDTAQREYNRFWMNLFLISTNSRWGLDIYNYNASNANRFAHSFLPWPLYYLNDLPSSTSGPTIHLSDGGQSGDNLGMVSLIRRDMDKIIVAAGEQDYTPTSDKDGFSDFASLCAVNRYLETQPNARHLLFLGHPNIAADTTPFDLTIKCDPQKVKLMSALESQKQDAPVPDAVRPLYWKHPVWIGQIVPSSVSQPVDNCKAPACVEVFYLMSGIDRPAWQKVVKNLRPTKASDSSQEHAITECYGTLNFPSSPAGKDDEFDCQVLYYLWEQRGDDVWRWPQTSTITSTFNGSSNMSRAYRSLGYFLGKKLEDIGAFTK